MHIICFCGPVAPFEAVALEGFYYISVWFDGVGIDTGLVEDACQDFTGSFVNHGIFVGVDVDCQSLAVFGGGVVSAPGVASCGMNREFFFSLVDFGENLLYGGGDFFVDLQLKGMGVFFTGCINVPGFYRDCCHVGFCVF